MYSVTGDKERQHADLFCWFEPAVWTGAKGATEMRACFLFNLFLCAIFHMLHSEYIIILFHSASHVTCNHSVKNSFRLSDPHRLKFTSTIMFANRTQRSTKSQVCCWCCVSLQSDLNRLDAWSKDSGLIFNETKCEAQRISRKLKPSLEVLESLVTERPGGGGVHPHKRQIGICRWMGSRFHDWSDYKGVAFSIDLLEWGRKFSGFWGK